MTWKIVEMDRAQALLDQFVAVYNDHQDIEGDDFTPLTNETAPQNGHFLHWLRVWSDDERGELLELLKKKGEANAKANP